MNIEILGFIAGIIVLVAHFPQIIKSIKTKHTQDISLMLYCMIWTAMLLWLLYGYYKGALAVFVMNSISIVSVSTMIFLKLRYGMNKMEVKQ
jgi:MtN3 and saliva related transmembrane protein